MKTNIIFFGTCSRDSYLLTYLIRLFIQLLSSQKCPGVNSYEIQTPFDKHHKLSSLIKNHQNTHNSVKYEVM